MKRLSLLLAYAMLLACTASPPAMESEAPSAEPAEAAYEDAVEEAEDKEEDEMRAELYPALADWLLHRQGACKQSPDAIDAQLQEHRRALAKTPQADDQILIQSRLQVLMLASCDFDRTGGLFRELLRRSGSQPNTPADYLALFELLSIQSDAYAALERRYAELEARHQETIEGIGDIESILEPQAEPDQ